MKVKAVERLLKFDKNSAGVYRYVMAPELYSSLSLTAITTTSCMGLRALLKKRSGSFAASGSF